ncbi:hydrogenase expression/formation protein HypE [Campylobacter pinnipediorum subsp. pinnipediorum]|uniref:hydrogenase expression/formation protein HypE n=1 Tax=Campylobacter pinnipediorum TaxID=1965231 RepID=UPI000994E414|nr:hydrogenase expression/formation protein HypE [Campylobacter pinnipediorum]AQW84519.1 hydrogenase expression/formation protein HypE [Campylobacter pinnipediorum subsp. pinnipediorum]
MNIMLSHGGGGVEMNSLINDIIFEIFDNETLKEANDSAILNISGDIAFSTDSFVVTPIFFNGGDIGKIAACGTINDLSMVGAEAKFLSCSLILEEGLSIDELKKVLTSLAKTCKESNVKVVCGDTKVVPKGKCDKIFINTSGIGHIVMPNINIKSLKPNAKILISGDIGRHGGVILANREEFELESDLQSDCKSLKNVVMELLNSGIKPLCMRDATRGGLSAVLNEWSSACKHDILIFEENIKVSDGVLGICELFGFEPYELANEGTFVLAVEEKDSKKALEILQQFDKNANEIGEILEDKNSRVMIENMYKSRRFLDAPRGELLPRIC